MDYEKLGREKVEDTIDGMRSGGWYGLGIITESVASAVLLIEGIREGDVNYVLYSMPLIADVGNRIQKKYKRGIYGEKLKGYFKDIIGKD